MLNTLKTLVLGANAAAEEDLRNRAAIPLIEQKIRETEASLRAAKVTLASLIQRQRSEARMLETLDGKISDMTQRAEDALNAEREDLAREAASAIAQMENERSLRQATLDRLDQKVARLTHSVEAGHRRVVDLRQGAVAAKAVRKEQAVTRRMMRHGTQANSAQEADELIKQVLGQDDPFEEAEILQGIEAGLSHETLTDRMAAEGFGAATKSTAEDVLKRLKTKSK